MLGYSECNIQISLFFAGQDPDHFGNAALGGYVSKVHVDTMNGTHGAGPVI